MTEDGQASAVQGGSAEERALAKVATGVQLLGIGVAMMIVAGVLGGHH